VPPAIFMGSATTKAPAGGTAPRFATFSKAGTLPAKACRFRPRRSALVDVPARGVGMEPGKVVGWASLEWLPQRKEAEDGPSLGGDRRTAQSSSGKRRAPWWTVRVWMFESPTIR